MKRNLGMVLMPDAPQMLEVVEAFKRYHEASSIGAPSEELERLKLLAESMLQAINDYQLQALGGPGYTSH